MDTDTRDNLTDTHEISLADETGVLKFLEHIGQLHSVVVELAAPYGEDIDVLEWVQYAQNMYRQLKSELYAAMQVISSGNTIDQQTVTKIQNLYDEMVLSRDTIASIELEDIVEEAISQTGPVLETLPSPYQRELLTDNITNHPEYRSVIDKHFRSPKAFESHLRRVVSKIEAPSQLDKALRLQQASVFYELLRDMSMAEIDKLLGLPKEELRSLLASKQMEYRLFIEWIDILNVVREIVPHQEDNTFAELLMAAELEQLIE